VKPTKPGHFVFISHSSADAWCAKQLHRTLIDAGAEAFLSVLDMEGGDEAGHEMRTAMDKADECLVLYSPEAAQSKNVWVEIGGAWMQKKRLTMILTRLSVPDVTGDPRFPPYLKSLNYYDLNTEFDSKYLPEVGARSRRQAGVRQRKKLKKPRRSKGSRK
jgi:hypothetical protein